MNILHVHSIFTSLYLTRFHQHMYPDVAQRWSEVIFWFAPLITPTPGDTQSAGAFFFLRDPRSSILQQFQTVFSLESHPRTNQLPADYRVFSQCPCFYLHLFTFTCLVHRERCKAHCQSTPSICHVSLSVSWSDILLSLADVLWHKVLSLIVEMNQLCR